MPLLAGLAALSSRLRGLHTLKLGGTSRVATISDASVAAISGLVSLTHLDLSGSHDITDAGMLCWPQYLVTSSA